MFIFNAVAVESLEAFFGTTTCVYHVMCDHVNACGRVDICDVIVMAGNKTLRSALLSSAAKIKKKECGTDTCKSFTRVFQYDQKERWNRLKAVLKATFDRVVTEVLLDTYVAFLLSQFSFLSWYIVLVKCFVVTFRDFEVVFFHSIPFI